MSGVWLRPADIWLSWLFRGVNVGDAKTVAGLLVVVFVVDDSLEESSLCLRSGGRRDKASAKVLEAPKM